MIKFVLPTIRDLEDTEDSALLPLTVAKKSSASQSVVVKSKSDSDLKSGGNGGTEDTEKNRKMLVFKTGEFSEL